MFCRIFRLQVTQNGYLKPKERTSLRVKVLIYVLGRLKHHNMFKLMIMMISIIFFPHYVHIGNTACYNVLVKNIFRVHMLKFGPNHLQTPKHFYHGYTQFKINILCGSFAIHKNFKHNRILFDLNLKDFRRLRHFNT